MCQGTRWLLVQWLKTIQYKNPECFKAKIYSDSHFQFHAILVWGMNEGFGLKTSQWVLRNLQTGPSYDFLHSLSWQRLIFFVSKILAINIIPHIWHVQVKYKQYFSNCKDSMMQESVVPWICYNKDHMSSQQRVWERSDWKDKASINTIFTDTMISYHNTSCDWLVIQSQISGSVLAQVMACCLTTPSHYLNQYEFIIKGVLSQSVES